MTVHAWPVFLRAAVVLASPGLAIPLVIGKPLGAATEGQGRHDVI